MPDGAPPQSDAGTLGGAHSSGWRGPFQGPAPSLEPTQTALHVGFQVLLKARILLPGRSFVPAFSHSSVQIFAPMFHPGHCTTLTCPFSGLSGPTLLGSFACYCQSVQPCGAVDTQSLVLAPSFSPIIFYPMVVHSFVRAVKPECHKTRDFNRRNVFSHSSRA